MLSLRANPRPRPGSVSRLFAESLRVRLLPRAHLSPRLVKQTLVVPFPYLLARTFVEQMPKGSVLVIDPQISRLIGRRDLVRAEEEPVRVTVDDVGHGPRRA